MEGKYEWKGNSRKIFDAVLAMSPWFVRSLSRNALLKGFQERQLTVITEIGFVEVCKEKVPERFLEKTLVKCEELRTKE
jgi:hypothetical protein